MIVIKNTSEMCSFLSELTKPDILSNMNEVYVILYHILHHLAIIFLLFLLIYYNTPTITTISQITFRV